LLGNLAGISNDGASFALINGGLYDPDKAYKGPKLCNMLFMDEAARRYKGKITANAFTPGLIADPNGFSVIEAVYLRPFSTSSQRS